MADITETRRKKLLAHLAEQGGVMPIAELHDWSGLKLLAAHQAFSQLMEGLTGDNLVLWDGKIFTITEEGRKIAATATKGKKGKAAVPAAEAAPVAAAAPVVEAAPVAAPAPIRAVPPPAPEPDGHDHGHDHDHGRVEAPRAETPPPRVAAPPPPRQRPESPPPEKPGLRRTLKVLLKKLIGRK